MKSREWMIGLGVLLSLMVFQPVWADDVKPEEEKLEDIVVTATRTEKSISSAPGSVSVVTRQDMDNRDIKSLDQALNTTVGVFDKNMGRGLIGSMLSVSMRGIPDDKRVLFLLDGYLPLNDGYTGGVSYQTMPVEDVQKIEVVKGPFSSLYGGNAMSGVVNVQTKMPNKREITLNTGYGSGFSRGDALDDMKKIFFSCGDKFSDNIRILASYGRRDTNGYPTTLNIQGSKPPAGITGYEITTDNKGNTRYLIGDSGDNTWWDDQITLKTGLDFSPVSKLGLTLIRSRYKWGYDNPHTYLKDANGNDVWNYGSIKPYSFLSGDGGLEQNIYGISYDTRLSSVLAKASFGYMDRGTSWYISRGATSSTTQDGGPGTYSTTPSASYNGDIQFTMPVLDRNILTFGSSYRGEWAHNEEDALSNWTDESTITRMAYEAKGNNRTISLFLQDEIAILDSLTAYLGGREDWWRTSDGYANSVGAAEYPRYYNSRDVDSFSPKAALVYKPFEETTFRTSVGKSFRAPSVYDLYRTWTATSGTTYQANPDLKPETVVSWDAGVEQGLWKGMKVRSSYFENYMTDLIYRMTVSSTLQQNINAGKAESKGVELEAEQRFDFGLKVFANYTYTNSILKENQANPATVGKKLVGVPDNMFNVGGTYVLGPLTASLTGRYVGKQYAYDDNSDVVNGVYGSYDPYFTADAKISYRITPNIVLSLSADNIFDARYYGYYLAEGCSWFTELTLKY